MRRLAARPSSSMSSGSGKQLLYAATPACRLFGAAASAGCGCRPVCVVRGCVGRACRSHAPTPAPAPGPPPSHTHAADRTHARPQQPLRGRGDPRGPAAAEGRGHARRAARAPHRRAARRGRMGVRRHQQLCDRGGAPGAAHGHGGALGRRRVWRIHGARAAGAAHTSARGPCRAGAVPGGQWHATSR